MILFLALIITHFFNYNILPFQKGYEFPTRLFLFTSLFGVFVCTSNWVVYYVLKLDEKGSSWKEIGFRIKVHAIATLVSYTILFLLIAIIREATFNPVAYFRFLQLCLGIVFIEFLLFELVFYTKSSAHENAKESKILIKCGNISLNVAPEEISFFHSSNGVISVHLKNKKRYITNFSSLDDLEGKLPEADFFRVSRQYILTKDTIGEVQREKNRKLTINLDPGICNGSTTRITVSRYKSVQFRNWMIGN